MSPQTDNILLRDLNSPAEPRQRLPDINTQGKTDRHTDSGDLSPTRTCVPYVLLATV